MLDNSAGRAARAATSLRGLIRRIDRVDVVDDELARLRGRALVTMALSRFSLGADTEAFELLDRAAREVTGRYAAEVCTLVTVQRAGLLGRRGDWAGVTETLSGIDPDSPAVTPRARSVIALSLGLAAQYLLDLDGSAAQLERARDLAHEADFPDLEFMAVHNLGHLAQLRGDLPAALGLMSRADAMPADVSRATSRVDAARVLLEAGLLDDAEERLREAAEVSRATPLELAEICLERARHALLCGDADSARLHARSAALRFRRAGAPAWQARARLLAVEAGLLADHHPGRVARAAVALADGGAEAAGIGTESHLAAAEALAAAGHPDEAAGHLVRTRGIVPLTTALQSSLAHACVARARGDTAAARRHLVSAAARVAAEQSRYAGLDNRTAIALHSRRLAHLDLEVALASGRAGAILSAVERWRGLSHRLDPVETGGDPRLAGTLGQLRQRHVELRRAGDDATRRAALVEVRRLETVVAQRTWEIARSTGDPGVHGAPASAPRIREHARARATGVLSLFSHRGRLHAVTVDGRVEVRDLAAVSDIAALTERLRADLRAAAQAPPEVRGAVRRSLRGCLTALDAVIRDVVPDRDRLLVVPSWALASVPWRMLPSLAGRPLVVSPSAHFWMRERTARTSERSVACHHGPELAGAAWEARSVAHVWGVEASNDASTGAAVAAALNDHRIVHVAAHGTHHEQSPLFSSLLMADGPLFAHEVQRVGVGAEHVVLSACDVGRVRMRPGDEGLGLASALLSCGVHSVVAATAPVPDDETGAVMTAYHRELAAGADAAVALERASADVPSARLFTAYGTDWELGGLSPRWES